jgi:hypothetical protein
VFWDEVSATLRAFVLLPPLGNFPDAQTDTRQGKAVTRSATKGTKGVRKQGETLKPVKRVVKAVKKTVGAAATAVKGLVRATTTAVRPRRTRRTKTETETETETKATAKPSDSIVVTTTTNETAEASAESTGSNATEKPSAPATVTTATNETATTRRRRKKATAKSTKTVKGAAKRKPKRPTSTVDLGEAAIQAASGSGRSSAPVIKENDPVFKMSRYELNQKKTPPFKRLTDWIPASVIRGMPRKPKTWAYVERSSRTAAEMPLAPIIVATATNENASGETRMVTRGQVGTVMRKRQYGEPEEETGMSGAQGASEHAPKRRRTSGPSQGATGDGATQASPNHSESTAELLALVDMPKNVVDYGTGTAPLVDTSGIEKKPRSTRSRRKFNGADWCTGLNIHLHTDEEVMVASFLAASCAPVELS